MGLTVEHHGSSRASDEALEVMQRLWDYKNGDPAYDFETDQQPAAADVADTLVALT